MGLSWVHRAAEAGLLARVGLASVPGDYPAGDAFDPVASSRPGVFLVGGLRAPQDIPFSVVDASAAAGRAGELLRTGRGSRVKEIPIPAQREVSGEAPRIGVIVCHCGSNIAGVVDCPGVREYAAGLPGVVHAEEALFACSQDAQERLAKLIAERGLNRVVVAACTPRTHEPLFQETLQAAGLNKYLLEMANIRNQCSWVHGGDHHAATVKARDLVRMAVAKAGLLAPLREQELAVNRRALVVGGGLAGMSAALSLAGQGFAPPAPLKWRVPPEQPTAGDWRVEVWHPEGGAVMVVTGDGIAPRPR